MLNPKHIGTDFFDEVNVGKVIVVKIGLDEIVSIPISPYKGTPSFLIDCHIRSKLREAGIPVSALTDTITKGEIGGDIEWWDDIEHGQRIFVWEEMSSTDTTIQS